MASEIKVDTISEKTSANGVTIDGVNIKDSALATAGSVPLSTIDIDGGTDIGAAIVDADLFIIDDGAGGTNRKTAASRLKTYIGGSDPASADGDTLGTASLEWSDLYLADSSVIYFGNDQDTTLTHTDGTGLTLNSTNKLCFNDASQFIQGASGTVLDIAATDEIELTATAIDINGTCDVSGTFSIGGTTADTGNSYISTILAMNAANNNLIVSSSTNGNNGLILENRLVGRTGNARVAQALFGADANDDGEIKFATAADGADISERMSINSVGVVKVNSRMIVDADVNSISKINAEFGGNNENGQYFNDKDGASSARYMAFLREGTLIGQIQRNGTNDAINYVTSSDYRLKDGVVNKTDGIEKVKLLKPRKFYWKSNTDKTLVDGFVAHEVSDIVPEAISGTKDATTTLQKVVVSASGNVVRTNIEQADWTHGKTEEGGEIYASDTTWEATKEVIQPQGIDQSKLVPLLTAALKEAITKIETLEAKVAVLEG